MILEYLDGDVKIYLRDDLDKYKQSILVTGFRGFGMVGFNVSKFLALGIGAKKVGFIMSRPVPPMVIVEEDGPGFPYDIYYSPRAETLIIVNRALPDREYGDIYAEAISLFAKDLDIRFAVLVGGLNANFRPEDEPYGYRYLVNEFYRGPQLKAKEMEEGLGVMGPLALLHAYLTLAGVGSVIVLPYAIADQIDVDAVKRGIRVIAEEILGVEVNMKSIEEYEEKLAREKEKLMQIILPMMQQASEEKEERKGIYM